MDAATGQRNFSASSCYAHRSWTLGTMFAPARMSISRSTGTAVARLAVTASLASMVRTIRIPKITVALRRRILIMVWVVRCSSLVGALNMPDTSFFLPVVRLVRICINVGDDGGGSTG